MSLVSLYTQCTYSFIDNEFKQTTSEFKTSLLTISDQQGGDSNWEKVRQEVTCAICLELLDDPKSMPCLHTYCKKCLMEAIAKRPHDPDLPRDRPAINCPLCRAEVPLSDQGIEALPSNFSATRLVETVQLQDKLEQNKTPLCDGCKESDAVASCCDCRGFFLCTICLKAHKNIPTTKSHTLMTLKDLSIPKSSIASSKNSPLCQKHPEELLKLYCQDCEVLVCRDCVLVTHKNHNYSFVDDAIEEEKRQLKDVTLQELEKILTSTKEAIVSVEQMQAEVLSCNDQHVDELNKTFENITDMVIKYKNVLLDKINENTKDAMSPLQKQQDDLTALKQNVEKCQDFTINTLHNGTNSEIMSARKQMLERTKHLKKLHNSSQLSPVTKPTKTVCYHLGKINKEIERIVTFVDLRQCFTEDVPLEAYKYQSAILKVILKDTKGQPICKRANIFTAQVTTPIMHNVIPSVKELGDGKYSVSFTPVALGDHVVSIQINGMHISKSPIKIPCVDEESSGVLNELVVTEPLVGFVPMVYNEAMVEDETLVSNEQLVEIDSEPLNEVDVEPLVEVDFEPVVVPSILRRDNNVSSFVNKHSGKNVLTELTVPRLISDDDIPTANVIKSVQFPSQNSSSAVNPPSAVNLPQAITLPPSFYGDKIRKSKPSRRRK